MSLDVTKSNPAQHKMIQHINHIQYPYYAHFDALIS